MCNSDEEFYLSVEVEGKNATTKKVEKVLKKLKIAADEFGLIGGVEGISDSDGVITFGYTDTDGGCTIAERMSKKIKDALLKEMPKAKIRIKTSIWHCEWVDA